MAGRKLAKNVVVGGVFYAAGSTPSAEVAAKIRNPKVWGDEPEDAKDESKQPAKKAAARKSS